MATEDEAGIALLLGQLMRVVHGVILSPVIHLPRMGEVAHAGSGWQARRFQSASPVAWR